MPIIVQPSHAERNRLASAAAAAMKSSNSGPMRLYVGSLHYNIDEDMLNTIFSPFGKVSYYLNNGADTYFFLQFLSYVFQCKLLN